MKKHKGLVFLFSFAVIAAVGFFVIAPVMIKKKFISRVGEQLPNHSLTIERVSLGLFSYSLHGVALLRKINQEPLMEIKKFKVQLKWEERLLSHVYFDKVVFTFVHDEASFGKMKKGENQGSAEAVRELTIGDVDALTIRNSEIHYLDPKAPKGHLQMTNIHFSAYDLEAKKKEENVALSALFMDHSKVEGSGSLSLANVKPEASFKLKFGKYPIKDLEGFLESMGNAKIIKGNMEAFAEINLKNEKFSGYLKPFMNDLLVKEAQNKEARNPGISLLIKALSSRFLKNDKNQSIGTLIPLSGDKDEIHVDFKEAIKSGFENSFGKPLKKGFE